MDMKKPKLLITGASGFLGSHLCRIASDRYDVFGISNKNRISINNLKALSFDLCDIKGLTEFLNRLKPDAVVHTAAMSAPNQCQEYPDESSLINVSVPLHIADYCQKQNISLVFTSTDLVFDGKRGKYSEGDPVSPISLYGEQKVKAEDGILDRCKNAVVCRLPLMFGDAVGTNGSFLQPMIHPFKNSVQQTLFTDEFRTPVSADSASEGILIALEKTRGVVHLGGRQRISRYDFGVMLAEIGSFDKNLIVPKLQKEIKFSAPRSSDVSLNSSKAFSLGYSPDNIREALSGLDCLSG